MKKVSVIGAGSWGTALASVLAQNGHQVFLHSKNKEIVYDINHYHVNKRYLPDVLLPENIICSNSYKEVLLYSDFVLMVVPSHATREVTFELKDYLEDNAFIVHASKGLEIDTFKRLSEIIRDVLPEKFNNQIGVLSGPSHAEEVVKKLPTTIVAASQNLEVAKKTQDLFMNEYFRVYTNDDVIGVELGGSLKNIIALAAGLCDGLGFGDNAKAALLTRGLAEITRLGVFLGAKPHTFSGLTGIGDLIVTGTSQHSRNWRTGNMLAQGFTLEQALEKLGMVAEGVKATKAAYQLSQEVKVDTPITNELYRILFENKNPRDAIFDLMTRKEKHESYDID